MPAPDWAQKMLFIIVPNLRTVSPEFFSWVRTRWLLSRHTCLVRSPSLCVQGKLSFSTFLNRNEGTTDESKKRLGCYQQEQFNLPQEYSVFDSSQCIVNNRKIEMQRQRESQISNSLTRPETTTLHVHHTFLYISLTSTARLPVKMPNFMFCEGHKQAMTKFILFMNLDSDTLMEIQLQKPSSQVCIWQSKRVGIITIETEKMWISFSMRHFCGSQPSWYLSKIP